MNVSSADHSVTCRSTSAHMSKPAPVAAVPPAAAAPTITVHNHIAAPPPTDSTPAPVAPSPLEQVKTTVTAYWNDLEPQHQRWVALGAGLLSSALVAYLFFRKSKPAEPKPESVITRRLSPRQVSPKAAAAPVVQPSPVAASNPTTIVHHTTIINNSSTTSTSNTINTINTVSSNFITAAPLTPTVKTVLFPPIAPSSANNSDVPHFLERSSPPARLSEAQSMPIPSIVTPTAKSAPVDTAQALGLSPTQGPMSPLASQQAVVRRRTSSGLGMPAAYRNSIVGGTLPIISSEGEPAVEAATNNDLAESTFLATFTRSVDSQQPAQASPIAAALDALEIGAFMPSGVTSLAASGLQTPERTPRQGPSDEQLQEAMWRSCQRLADTEAVPESENATPRTPKTQRIHRALDADGESEDAHLLKWLRWIRVADYDAQTRSMGAEWLVFYHQKVLESSNHSLIARVYKDLRADMEKAWRLLMYETDPDSVHPGSPLLIATMLRDPARMQPHFDRLLEREQEQLAELREELAGSTMSPTAEDAEREAAARLSEEEIKLAFMAAPFLGRWHECLLLGERVLASNPDGLLDFHRVAREPPFHFLDHEVLFHMAHEEVERATQLNVNSSQLAAEQCAPAGVQRRWRIDSFRLQLADVHAQPNNGKAARVRAALDPNGDAAWRDIRHSTASAFIARYGALAQTHSFFSHALPLVGPADDRRINVLGYMFIDSQDAAAADSVLNSPTSAVNPNETRRQTEHYDLHCVDETKGIWGGTYVIYQDTLNHAMQPVHSLHIAFNVEAVLVAETASTVSISTPLR